MFFRTSVAAFFFDKEINDISLDSLLTLAGFRNFHYLLQDANSCLDVQYPNLEIIYGEWGDFGDAWARLDKLEYHNCLQIYFSMNHFLDLLPENMDDKNFPFQHETLLPLAKTFGNLCEQLQAEVAFLDTSAHYGDESWEIKQGNRDWVINFYPMMLKSNYNVLTDEPFSLLYLSNYATELWDPSQVRRTDCEIILLTKGRLLLGYPFDVSLQRKK